MVGTLTVGFGPKDSTSKCLYFQVILAKRSIFRVHGLLFFSCAQQRDGHLSPAVESQALALPSGDCSSWFCPVGSKPRADENRRQTVKETRSWDLLRAQAGQVPALFRQDQPQWTTASDFTHCEGTWEPGRNLEKYCIDSDNQKRAFSWLVKSS